MKRIMPSGAYQRAEQVVSGLNPFREAGTSERGLVSDKVYSISEIITSGKTYELSDRYGQIRSLQIYTDRDCTLTIVCAGESNPVEYPLGVIGGTDFTIKGKDLLVERVILVPVYSGDVKIKIFMSNGLVDFKLSSAVAKGQSPQSGDTGLKTATTTASQLTTTPAQARTIIIMSEPTNTDYVKIGFNTTPQYRLDVGDVFTLDFDDPSLIYVQANAGNQDLCYLYTV